MNKKEYTDLGVFWGFKLKDVVKILHKYRDEGKKVKTDFNGIILYSDTVTLEGAYKEVTGRSFDEYCEFEREERKKMIREEKEYEDKIPQLTIEWIEKGHNILDRKYWDSWDECVPIRLRDLYHGWELGCTLDIVEKLNNDCDFSEVKVILDEQGHSAMSFHLMCAMIKTFCDRGEEFITTVQ